MAGNDFPFTWVSDNGIVYNEPTAVRQVCYVKHKSTKRRRKLAKARLAPAKVHLALPRAHKLVSAIAAPGGRLICVAKTPDWEHARGWSIMAYSRSTGETLWSNHAQVGGMIGIVGELVWVYGPTGSELNALSLADGSILKTLVCAPNHILAMSIPTGVWAPATPFQFDSIISKSERIRVINALGTVVDVRTTPGIVAAMYWTLAQLSQRECSTVETAVAAVDELPTGAEIGLVRAVLVGFVAEDVRLGMLRWTTSAQ